MKTVVHNLLTPPLQMSSDSEEADELQKEFDELMDENRRLKDSQVKVSQIPYHSLDLTLNKFQGNYAILLTKKTL